MSRKSAWAIRAIAIAAAAFVAYRVCVIPYRCNHAVLEGRLRLERVSSSRSDTLARTEAAIVEQMLRRYATTCNSVNVQLLLASAARLQGHVDDALERYGDALTVEPRPEIYFDRGMAKLDAGQVADAERDLVVAAKFNPVFLEEISGELRNRVTLEAGQ
jgi:tetratricopeptide (TPR) repeat protein